jgi:dUTP pyrophosphatase
MNRLSVYRTAESITLPKFATKQSACFDLSFQSAGKYEFKGYNQYNAPFNRQFSDGKARLMPGDRALLPTGLIFDIPKGYSVRIHPRSGLSLKQGLTLANMEAVIDSDYVDETFIMVCNTSEVDYFINNGDRIAQAELVKQEEYVLWEVFKAPEQKTDRAGGLGSTGVAVFEPKDIMFTQPVKRGRGRPRKVVNAGTGA